MKKLINLITLSTMVVGFTVASASAFQAAPESAAKAKEMMEKNADKGKAEKAKMDAMPKKMEGEAKAEAAKMKEKPPVN